MGSWNMYDESENKKLLGILLRGLNEEAKSRPFANHGTNQHGPQQINFHLHYIEAS